MKWILADWFWRAVYFVIQDVLRLGDTNGGNRRVRVRLYLAVAERTMRAHWAREYDDKIRAYHRKKEKERR